MPGDKSCDLYKAMEQYRETCGSDGVWLDGGDVGRDRDRVRNDAQD